MRLCVMRRESARRDASCYIKFAAGPNLLNHDVGPGALCDPVSVNGRVSDLGLTSQKADIEHRVALIRRLISAESDPNPDLARISALQCSIPRRC